VEYCPLIQQRIDTLDFTGATHYPLLAPVLRIAFADSR
jgi:glutamate racemase